ncbi:MAG TPA: phytoene/squalene synthase family protein [Chloroflexota bacterium]|nr:phytoene/squalene synthase family protein [Chloroflexota bacterium]
MVSQPIAQHSLPVAMEVTKRVARTFSLAIRFLPGSVRDDVYLLYFVCRTLDDLVDTHQPEAGRRLEQVGAWAQGGGAPAGREETILDELLARYPDMPREAVVDFCRGQLDELGAVPIETEADLDLHAYRVAGTVGRLMSGLLGVRSPDADVSARALGIAMQRTNILRDIDEDLARGRVYIPAETMEALEVRDLARESRRRLLELEIAIADRWYERGLEGTAYLRQGRWQVRAAALMYREILRQLERDGLGRIRPNRAAVSGRRKLWLLARATAAR